MVSGGFKGWLPNRFVARFLAIWLAATAFITLVVVPAWARHDRETTCSRTADPRPVADAGWIGQPGPDALLSPKLTFVRGTAEDSVSWPTGTGAPNGEFSAGSSSLLPEGDGRILPSSSVLAWIEVDNRTAVLVVCVDSAGLGLDHGTYAGFVFVPTSDPARTLTVRHEVAVQSTYTGSFWPLSVVVVFLGVALAHDKLAKASKPVKWLAAFTGFGAFSGAYSAGALSNPTWGGLEAVGTLVVAAFTASIGAIAAAAATAAGPAPAGSEAEPAAGPPAGPPAPPPAG